MANTKITQEAKDIAYGLFIANEPNEYIAKVLDVSHKTIERLRCSWYIETTLSRVKKKVEPSEITEQQVFKQIAFIKKHTTSEQKSILITHKENLKQLHNKLNNQKHETLI